MENQPPFASRGAPAAFPPAGPVSWAQAVAGGGGVTGGDVQAATGGGGSAPSIVWGGGGRSQPASNLNSPADFPALTSANRSPSPPLPRSAQQSPSPPRARPPGGASASLLGDAAALARRRARFGEVAPVDGAEEAAGGALKDGGKGGEGGEDLGGGRGGGRGGGGGGGGMGMVAGGGGATEEGEGGGDEADWQLAEAVVGTCPDMCPGMCVCAVMPPNVPRRTRGRRWSAVGDVCSLSHEVPFRLSSPSPHWPPFLRPPPAHEREVRERSGALDVFERVNGDRSKTNAQLAIKKLPPSPLLRSSPSHPLPHSPFPTVTVLCWMLVHLLPSPSSPSSLPFLPVLPSLPRPGARRAPLPAFPTLLSPASPLPQYSRAPNMDPSFIRPMPVLHTTMAHMLSLLHLPFPPPPSAAKGGAEEGEMEGEGGGEEAGGAGGPGMRLLLLHSFLWDRMRAVRADLRMQHLFGREAINMHEQMVRFHIVAMHELCEYPKGEGFSDGFDAHLNIEQMNKACVDLFHMYHDRRADLSHAQAMASEGGEEGEVGELQACLAQEGELRGYYLLLKIDRHPGFNVEPAEFARELSLLPHIVRSSPQVVFARSVARACRTHNFVAFFRLARQATYLQACLMHAHFSKMRSRALAAVYASIAKGQQLPALTLAHWLGMEQEPEKLQALVEHHGLALHPSDAPADATYPDTASPASALLAGSCLVKGAPLVQAGTPMPPSSSALVRSKQSRFIDDVIAEMGQLRRLRQLAVSDWQLEGSIASQPTVVASKQAPHKRLRGAATWGAPALGKASADRGVATAGSRPALAAPSADGPRFLHPSSLWGKAGFAAPTAFAAPSPLDVARLVGGRLAGRQVPSSSAGPLLGVRRVVSWKLLVCWPERESQDTPSPVRDATHWLCSTLSAPSHALNALQHHTEPHTTPHSSAATAPVPNPENAPTSASQPTDPSLLACYVAPMPHRTAAGEAAPKLPGGASGAASGEITRAGGAGSVSDSLFWLVVRRVSAEAQGGDGGRFLEGAQAMVCVVDGSSNAGPQVQRIRQAVASLPTSLTPIPLLLLVLPPHPPPPSSAAAAAAASMSLCTGPCAPVPVPSSFASLTLSHFQPPSTRPPPSRSSPPAPRLSALRILPLGRSTPPQPDDLASPDWPAKIALTSGLRWLADSSPLPPQLAPIPLRDLVLRHLSPRVTRLLAVDPSLVRPQECITEFNASLDSAANDVATAVAASPPGSGTPLPELPALLQLMGGRKGGRQRELSGESGGSEMGESRSKAGSAASEAAGRLEVSLLSASLPPIDWNSPSRTSRLTTALSSLRLPHFPALHLSSPQQPSLTSPSSSPSPTLSLPPHLSSLAPQLHPQLAPLLTALNSFLRLVQGDQTSPVLLAQQLLAEGCGVVWRSGAEQGQPGEQGGEQGGAGSARSAGRLCAVPVWPRILLPVLMRRLDALFSDPPLTAFVLAPSAPPAAHAAPHAAALASLAPLSQSTAVVPAAMAVEGGVEVGASAVESGAVGLGSMLPVSALTRQEGLVGTGMARELIRTSGSAWVGGAAAASAASEGVMDDNSEEDGGNEVVSSAELPPLLAAPAPPSLPYRIEPYQSYVSSKAWHASSVPIPGLPTSISLLRSSAPSYAAAAALAPHTSLLPSRPTPSPSPSPPPPLLQLPHPSTQAAHINQPPPHSHLLPASHHVPLSLSRTNHELSGPILPVPSHSQSQHSLARHPPLPLYKPGSGSVYKPATQHGWERGIQVKRKAPANAWSDGYGGGGRVGRGSGREGDERGEGEERGGVERKGIERGWVESEGKGRAEHWFGPGGRRQQLRLAEADGLVANEMLPRGIVRAADVVAASGAGEVFPPAEEAARLGSRVGDAGDRHASGIAVGLGDGGGDKAEGLLSAGANERRVREMVEELMKRRQVTA
ncbi:unnamed protein product [Closterium sp. Naga37s-1]|nr:unnamed protein product [Closterium sp. Naga37s-1]